MRLEDGTHNLRYMAKFAREVTEEILQITSAKLSWSHNIRPEFNGQFGSYVTAVDGELKGELDNPTIRLLLCKTKNHTVAEYSLQSSSMPIGVSEYRVGHELPEGYVGILPSPEDLLGRI